MGERATTYGRKRALDRRSPNVACEDGQGNSSNWPVVRRASRSRCASAARRARSDAGSPAAGCACETPRTCSPPSPRNARATRCSGTARARTRSPTSRPGPRLRALHARRPPGRAGSSVRAARARAGSPRAQGRRARRRSRRRRARRSPRARHRRTRRPRRRSRRRSPARARRGPCRRVDTVPITRAPSALPHAHRNEPTPPAAACTRIVSPGRTRCVRCSRYSAVRPLSISVAAASSSTSSGSATTCAAGTVRTSTYAPGCGATYATRSPGQQVRDAVADVDDRAGGFHARRRGRLEHPVASGANVDIDEVHADRRMTDADFAGTRRGRGERCGRQHLGAAVAGHDDAARGQRFGLAAARADARARRRAAGSCAALRSRLRTRPCRRDRANSRSRPRGGSNVDSQCQNVRSPSVTRLSWTVAT